MIRDGLLLFSESLAATGDPFGIYGFTVTRQSSELPRGLPALYARLSGRA